MAEVAVNQKIRYKGKNYKVVEIKPDGMVRLKCMVCGGKYIMVHKDQL